MVNRRSTHVLGFRIIFGILAAAIVSSGYSRQEQINKNFETGGGFALNCSNSKSNEESEQKENCTRPAVEEFPGDFFTQDQRIRGGFLVHAIICTYLIFSLGIICDDYFVPALDVICSALNMSPDVAGATFMAAGTSAPEFFANVIGTFVMESDLGIGTIIGSAVFNIFGIIAICGLFTKKAVDLEWYPITRDCFVYGVTIIILILVMMDEQVFWYESLGMLIAYLAYIVVMFFNTKIEKWAQNVFQKVSAKWSGPSKFTPTLVSLKLSSVDSEKNIFHTEASSTQNLEECSIREGGDHDDNSSDVETKSSPWKVPSDSGFLGITYWALFLPISLLFFISVPRGHKFLVPLSFLMCSAWIGGITYVVAWMISLIGYTFGIPDSVMGLTFLAIGTSVPEVFSSLIVSKQGKGSMAVSNSIGSNTFDILVCLGLPWLIKSIITGFESEIWFVTVHSEGFTYTVISLLASLFIIYFVLIVGKFMLTKMLGLVSLALYSIFLVISILFETNVFFDVNLPMCETDL